MVFSSTIFLFLFLPLVLLIYYLIDRKFKNYFLLLASLIFYASGEPMFVFVMIGSALLNHVYALFIDRQLVKSENSTEESDKYKKNAKRILVLMVISNLLLFFVYKYLNFTIFNINNLFEALGLSTLPQTSISLPIGISFFTFQAMSYVFDVYYRKGKVQKNPFYTLLYISLFPQLVAGPIVRYQSVADEIEFRRETLADFAGGIKRFIIGLAKKVIIANTVAVAADYAFSLSADGTATMGICWLGAIAYSMQILFDFSGYSDMAIGLGQMFGFHFSENFNSPYSATTVSDFWRRWHISLGSWFRDYVYIPLGGSRVGKGRLIVNLLAVWGLTGIWHGANWTFLTWGLFYFVLLTFEKLVGIDKYLKKSKAMAFLYRIFTLLCVMLGWVVFRADDISHGLSYIGSLFGAAPGGVWNSSTTWMLLQYAVIFAIAIVCCINWKAIYSKVFKERKIFPVVSGAFYIVIAVLAISFTVASTYNPFIYFNF